MYPTYRKYPHVIIGAQATGHHDWFGVSVPANPIIGPGMSPSNLI